MSSQACAGWLPGGPRGPAGARPLPVVLNWGWKDDPLAALTAAIEAAITPLVTEGVERDPSPQLAGSRRSPPPPRSWNVRLLVILDQFEEYFVYTAAEPTPGRFADELSHVINDNQLPAHVLISIREDAYAGLGDLFKGRLANVYGNYLDVAYLDRGVRGRGNSATAVGGL